MLYYMTHTYIVLSHEMCYVLVLNVTIERSLLRALERSILQDVQTSKVRCHIGHRSNLGTIFISDMILPVITAQNKVMLKHKTCTY